MVEPRIEAQPGVGERRESLAEARIRHQMRRHWVAGVEHDRIRVMGGDVADAAEPPASGALVRIQHHDHARAEAQVGVPDDPPADARRAVATGRAHRGDTVDELGLADRAHLLRPAGAVEGAALYEHGGGDAVPGAEIGQQIGKHVAPVGPIPQMVVRIDDRQRRVERRLLPSGQPVLAHRQVMAGCLRGLSVHRRPPCRSEEPIEGALSTGQPITGVDVPAPNSLWRDCHAHSLAPRDPPGAGGRPRRLRLCGAASVCGGLRSIRSQPAYRLGAR